MRGNQPQPLNPDAGWGSIPACAGEPHSGHPSTAAPGVYPRVCGGTLGMIVFQLSHRGLSPRVRGNPKATGGIRLPAGSIPACAGEPMLFYFPLSISRVYPRVCGGTPRHPCQLRHPPGLSPRVRGNLLRAGGVACDAGSIPACAGEPRPISWLYHLPAVYPRVCGGTQTGWKRR